MKIGIVLSQSPNYSETFFNAKIKGLKANGMDVLLLVQKANSDFNTCPVLVAPKIYKNKLKQGLQTLMVLGGLVPHTKRVLKLLKLEKQSGRPLVQRFKNVVTNAHLLKAKVDWLHFGFATLVLQSENIAMAINAKMAVSCRGYDMDVYPLKHPKCYILLWNVVDKVHVISNYMEEKARTLGMHSNTVVEKITPAINLNKFKKDEQTSNSKLLHISTVARLHWIKGLIHTLEALAIVKSKGLAFKYTLVGEGPQYGELVFAIHQLGLTDNVQLLGKQNQAQVIECLQHTEVYLQFSESEGFCNAVLEAQALGCICLVSDGGALPENVLHNETGFVVPKQNTKSLADEIYRVAQLTASQKNGLSKTARMRLEKEFSLEKQAIEFKRFYQG